jgi:hypothetical protein
MKCANCPLYTSWNNESDKGEACGLFGDSWDSPFQYENTEGCIVGCYIDRHFIERVDRRYEEELTAYVNYMLENEQQRSGADGRLLR